MTDPTAAPPTNIETIARHALTRVASAVATDDVTAAERWLKVARGTGLDPNTAVRDTAETTAERRASRDRLLAVLIRKFERISLQMQEDADGVPRLPSLSSSGPTGA